MKPVLTVVADDNMLGVEACLAHLQAGHDVRVQRVAGRHMQPSSLIGCDWLLLRSITKVNADLLAKHQPSFIGTATIGTDHLDLDLIQQHQISWSAAPGCNALAVAQWLACVLAHILSQQSKPLSQLRLGIVGLGNVGKAVANVGQALGLQVSAHDPFLTAGPVPLLSLSELLSQSDVVTVHTPLTRSGPHPTEDLINTQALSQMLPTAWLINAGRGEVINQTALIDALRLQRIQGAVLDVWPNEPDISAELLALVSFGSPHIAGHSLEGKWRGTWMIVAEACKNSGLPPPPPLSQLMPNHGCMQLTLAPPSAVQSDTQRLAAMLHQCVDIVGDDQRLRQDPTTFDQLRKSYPVRREFMAHDLLAESDDPLRQVLGDLGFRC
ncbi:MAG: 4-phosphoerythronate dehydrogenase [Moraxellaceae bacterium]|nr:4-phosphoerythronate dehydrogenase [Moraxellaceae bacterium]MDZ4297573.1 4-phosphoerythronate dehydrogenase [Moraxellaceae bacterium]MDZ4387788.1 4-phosphoerythronate dehydrogenase [Moraxellaceae bacterium]